MTVTEPTTQLCVVAVTYSDTLVTVQVHTRDEGDAYKNQYVFCGNNPVNFRDPLGLNAIGDFFTEGYENVSWSPFTWYHHGNYGGAGIPPGIGAILVAPPYVDALDRQAYFVHDWGYWLADTPGVNLSGRLWMQGVADFRLAGRLWSQTWRYSCEDGITGLHGQLHGTIASFWFPIQGTAQLVGGTAVRLAEWIRNAGISVVNGLSRE